MMTPSLLALTADNVRHMPMSRPSLQEALMAIAAQDQAKAEPQRKAEKRDKTPLAISLGALAAGQLADAFSTHQALQRPGVVEGNAGIYGENPSLGRLLATKAAVTVPMALLMHKLYKDHPKVAQALGYGVDGLGGAMAIRNSQVGK